MKVILLPSRGSILVSLLYLALPRLPVQPYSIDERKARAQINTDLALREAITHATGIVGLILLAKHRGRIAVVRLLLDELIRQSFRISPTLYQETLHQAGEL